MVPTTYTPLLLCSRQIDPAIFFWLVNLFLAEIGSIFDNILLQKL
jgi:hypothetical protein